MNHTRVQAKVITPVSVGAMCFLAVALAALPATSHAQQWGYTSEASYAQQWGYTSRVANLRAGPSQDYPVVATLPAGISMTVVGCLSDYQWCDVVVGQYRGWVYAGSIVYSYQGRSVPLITYGPTIGIGITAFSLGNYWDNYYRAYPWYPQRQRWINRPQPRSDFAPRDDRRHQQQQQAPFVGRDQAPNFQGRNPGAVQRAPQERSAPPGQSAPQLEQGPAPGQSPRDYQRQQQDRLRNMER